MRKTMLAVASHASPMPVWNQLTEAHAISALAALAQPTRLAIFRLLIKHEPVGITAGVIADTVGAPHNTLVDAIWRFWCGRACSEARAKDAPSSTAQTWTACRPCYRFSSTTAATGIPSCATFWLPLVTAAAAPLPLRRAPPRNRHPLRGRKGSPDSRYSSSYARPRRGSAPPCLSSELRIPVVFDLPDDRRRKRNIV